MRWPERLGQGPRKPPAAVLGSKASLSSPVNPCSDSRSPTKVPSVRMVKGESPGRRAENWPPSDVIRKQSEKKPMPRTKSLRGATGQVSGTPPKPITRESGRMKDQGAELRSREVSPHHRIETSTTRTRPRATHKGQQWRPLGYEVGQVLISDRAWILSRGPPSVVPGPAAAAGHLGNAGGVNSWVPTTAFTESDALGVGQARPCHELSRQPRRTLTFENHWHRRKQQVPMPARGQATGADETHLDAIHHQAPLSTCVHRPGQSHQSGAPVNTSSSCLSVMCPVTTRW